MTHSSRISHHATAACLAALLLLSVGGAAQQLQYERPVSAAPTAEDIGEDYAVPNVQFHPPRSHTRELLDVTLLAAALGLGAWLTLYRRWRTGVLLLTIACVAYFGFYRQGCVCPIGAIQNVAVALIDGSYTISLITVIIFFLPLIFAAIFGRIFCGGICPLGAIQELVVLRPIQVPRKVDWTLGWLKWVYLGLAIWIAIKPAETRDFIICRFDPFVGFFRFTGVAWVLLIGAALLVIGLFIGRPYCRYLCPYGALLSLPSRIAWRRVSVTPDKELDCGLCEEACPYGAIDKWRAVPSTCVACARCYQHCPRQHAPDNAPSEDAS